MSVTFISDDLRSAVIARDGTNCLRCFVQCTFAGPTKLHIDHVVPEVLGGPTTLENLQVLCRTCNLQKGATTVDYRGPMTRLKILAVTSGHGVTVLEGAQPQHRGMLRVICHCGAHDTGWAKPHWWSGTDVFIEKYAKHIRSGRRGTRAQHDEVTRLLSTVVAA
jgi:hypothetical protein